jgi:hypothetical protein
MQKFVAALQRDDKSASVTFHEIKQVDGLSDGVCRIIATSLHCREALPLRERVRKSRTMKGRRH